MADTPEPYSPKSFDGQAHRYIDEFKSEVKNYCFNHSCFGLDGLDDSRKFVPKEFLKDYWNAEKIARLLSAASGPNVAAHDINLILREYLVVFSILTYIGKPDRMREFTDTQMKDSSLPLRIREQMPEQWKDRLHNEELWREFVDEQWQFCPIIFGPKTSMFNAKIYEQDILPILSKDKLNKDQDDGDLAILYKVKLHPDCKGKLSDYVVFKEYQRDDPDAGELYNNEISIYTTLMQKDSAFDNIIRYYGSFDCFGRRTIILEYADGGDLSTFFQVVEKPSSIEQLRTFWINFFKLLLALDYVHNLNPPKRSSEEWFLEGVHQDIRSKNILLMRNSPNNPYDVTFKLVDFGTGYIKKHLKYQRRVQHQDNQGNTIYSSPESYNGRVYPESDVWSLGALASEALVWSFEGWDGVVNYLELRRAKTSEILQEYYRGCFHDGIMRLSIIDDVHQASLAMKLEQDNISPAVSEMILKHMLVERPGTIDRLPSDRDSPFRRDAKTTYTLWTQKIPRMSPNRQTKSSPSVVNRDGPPLYMPPIDAGTFSSPAPESSPVLPLSHRPSHYDPRDSRVLPNRSTTQSSQFSHGSSSSNHRNRRVGLHTEPRDQSMDSPATSPTEHTTNTRADRASIIRELMESMDNPGESLHYGIQSERTNLDSTTIDDIYERFIIPKDNESSGTIRKLGGMLSRMADSSQDSSDPLKFHERLRQSVDKLKNSGHGGREQIFLIDDSASMRQHRDSIGRTVRVLAYLIKRGDVDPDRSIELYYTSQPAQKIKNSNSHPLQKHIAGWRFDDDACEMSTALEALLLEIIPRPYDIKPKPVSIYVLTNGRWTSNDPNDLCRVDEVIEKVLGKLDSCKHPLADNWLGIQFIDFPQGMPDTIGSRRLQFLDDKLEELFGRMGLNISRK